MTDWTAIEEQVCKALCCPDGCRADRSSPGENYIISQSCRALETRLKDTRAALEASHHKELVEALEFMDSVFGGPQEGSTVERADRENEAFSKACEALAKARGESNE